MKAKSAPQLRRVSQSSAAEQQLRGIVLVFALALLAVGVNWLLEVQDGDVRNPAAATSEGVHADAVAGAQETQAEAENPRHLVLSEFLAKRYKVSQAVTLDLVAIAYAAGQQIGLDPLLIIAVMAVESRFNPIAESVAGAKGLMQVIPKYHAAKFRKFGGNVFDPETNILVGAQILKEYIARTGSVTSALQMYVGSTSDDDDSYFGRVMNEKQRLQQVLRKAPPPPRRLDVET